MIGTEREIHDTPVKGSGQYFISKGRIIEAGRDKYPYFGKSEEMIVLFSSKNEGTIISNEDNFDIGVFVDNLDESQFVRLAKGTMLEVVI